jgi:hypothetical protein
MLEPNDMAALNQELDQIVANLGEVSAPPPAPERLAPPPPSYAHPAPTITVSDTPSSQVRDRHALSTLRLDSGEQPLAELRRRDAELNAQPPAPPLIPSQPLGKPRSSSASTTGEETKVELNLKDDPSWRRWLIPIISLLIGASVSYLILTRGGLGL